MKTLSAILFSGTILFLYSGAMAQFSFGPVAGINFSATTGGADSIDYNRDYGFKAGVIGDVPLHKNIFLHTGILFNTESYRFEFSTHTTSIDTVEIENVNHYHQFGYVQAPLEIKFKFFSGLHAEGGAFAAYQVSQHFNEWHHYITSIGSHLPFLSEEQSSNHEITAQRFQAGMTAGVGYMKSGFDLSLAAQYYLTTLFDLPNSADYRKQHLLGFSLSLAYYFNAGG